MTVEVNIANSIYKIACHLDDDQKIIECAKKLNQRILKLKNVLENIDEKTAIVITALMMEDEIKKLQLKYHDQNDNLSNHDQALIETITDNNIKICERLEKLIDNIENN